VRHLKQWSETWPVVSDLRPQTPHRPLVRRTSVGACCCGRNCGADRVPGQLDVHGHRVLEHGARLLHGLWPQRGAVQRPRTRTISSLRLLVIHRCLLGNSARSRHRPLGGVWLRSATVPSGVGIPQMIEI
jgi:hypothetical protein